MAKTATVENILEQLDRARQKQEALKPGGTARTTRKA
jgi:hypothetical protein